MVKDGRYYNMIVYKAVTARLLEVPTANDLNPVSRNCRIKMLSRYFHDSKFELEYKLNQDTYPRIGKIFCFASMPKEWIRFIPAENGLYKDQLWLKCITDKVESCDDLIPSTSDTKIVTDYWTRQMLYDTFVMQPPNDTVLCNWIKPIEIL